MLRTAHKTVPASTAIALTALPPLGSYVASTGSHGEPLREYIASRVDIAVVLGAAGRAIPGAHGERQRFNYGAARRTCLAGWIPAANPDKDSSVQRALVFQHSAE